MAAAKKETDTKEVKKDRYVEVTVPYDPQHEDLTVGLNGKIYKVKAGEPTQVPEAVAEIILNSFRQDRKTRILIRQLSNDHMNYGTM